MIKFRKSAKNYTSHVLEYVSRIKYCIKPEIFWKCEQSYKVFLGS